MSEQALAYLTKDELLADWIQKIGPLDLKPKRQDPFISLTRAIIFQQLNGKVADVILGRFVKLFDSEDFPTPKQVAKTSVEKLRTAGLSGPKANYILDLAQRAQTGLIPSLKECDAMTDEEIIEELTEVKGVGRWTAEMLLIFNLGRPDVFPIQDLGIQRGTQIVYGKRKMPTPKQLLKLGKPWIPYRTVASRYLWKIAGMKVLPKHPILKT